MSKIMTTYISLIIQIPFSSLVPDYLNKSPQQVLSNLQTDVNAHKLKLQTNINAHKLKLSTNRNAHKLKLQTNHNVLIVKELVIWKKNVLISILVAIVAIQITHQRNAATNDIQPD